MSTTLYSIFSTDLIIVLFSPLFLRNIPCTGDLNMKKKNKNKHGMSPKVILLASSSFPLRI